jgi:NAD(P)-dependent dehydrogenase (short-subunit alcohol dehydrogenase family)
MDIDGASAMVTGGASGLGEATAHALARTGCRVVIADRQAGRGKEVAEDVSGVFRETDVTDPGQVQGAIDAASELGPLRVLVNCAGIGRAARTLCRDGSPMDLAAFERVIRINLLGTFNCLRLAASSMSRTGPLADGERREVIRIDGGARMPPR